MSNLAVNKINEEIYYPSSTLVPVSTVDIEYLKQRTFENERKRARLCTHQSVLDNLHEMLIVHTSNTYVRPHRHLNKTESLHVIEGMALLILFDEKGNVTNSTQLGSYSSGLTFYCRISEPIFHSLVIQSDVFVFHEVTNGPFNPEETEYSQWSPQSHDTNNIKLFLMALNTHSVQHADRKI